MRPLRLVAVAAAAVLPRPRLWGVAVRQWWRMVPDQWWRRRPFLPVPRRPYIDFRLATQYPANEDAPTSGDVVDYLAWCKGWR